MRQLRLSFFGLLLVVGVVNAQTPLPTLSRPPESIKPLQHTMLSAVETAVSSGAVKVNWYPNKVIQVCAAAGTCTSFNMVIEGLVGGTVWSTLGTAITQADVAAGACQAYIETSMVPYIQARITAIDTCTLSVYLYANP